MSYTVEQKIGNGVYLYEVECYWDSEKKQPRQRRRYLGKKDATTGEIITPRKGITPRSCRDYGQVYLLSFLAREIGLTSVLSEVFGREAPLLLALAIFEVSEHQPLYLFQGWLENTWYHLDQKGDSQRLSELCENLGRMDRERELFFRSWIKVQGNLEAVVFDITSLSSYSRGIDLVEWGYNRNGEVLPQVNLGVVYAKPQHLPITYRVYPGSIADVATLKTTTLFLQELGVKDVFYVLDRGFFSQENLEGLFLNGITFVMPLPFTTSLAPQLLRTAKAVLHSSVSGFCFEDQALFHTPKETTINGKTAYAHLYFDEKRRAEEMDRLIHQLEEVEKKIEEKAFESISSAYRYLEDHFFRLRKLFSISIHNDRVKVIRKGKAITRLSNRMGHTILLTNQKEGTKSDILSLYRSRDLLEKLFDILKNEINGGRLRVSSRAGAEGRIFLYYLSLILYSALANAMKKHTLYSKWTVTELLSEMKKIRVVEMSSGKQYLTEITKKQRTLFDKLSIPVPVGVEHSY